LARDGNTLDISRYILVNEIITNSTRDERTNVHDWSWPFPSNTT
jgi:hypothetical protein